VLAHPVPGHGTGELLPGPGHLELRGVSAAGALKEVDLAVSGGKAVAVVGRSGSGKSLLAALAGRLADPDAGEILLDGVPLAGLRKDVLRREVAYAFARPVLFGETVADAVGFGSVRCSRRLIELAAETACADPFIRRLPEGYDTALGDAPMSGGEAQRIGLARAFARPSRLLILDDATSSLDTATELQVSEAVLGRFSDRTRLIVAHRAATAAEADLVIWLEDGRVRGCGTHHVLWLDRDYRAVFGADRP
jgi:ATP-binding cassette subfamily B protein